MREVAVEKKKIKRQFLSKLSASASHTAQRHKCILSHLAYAKVILLESASSSMHKMSKTFENTDYD